MTGAKREFIVGAIFTATVVLLGFFTIVVSNFNPFAPPKELWVFFNDVGGLRKGNVVRIAGLEVGKVESMSLLKKGVIAKLVVVPGVTLHEGYSVKVRAFSPLGGKYVDVVRGNLGAPEKSGNKPPEGHEEEALVGGTESELISELSEIAEKIKPMVISAVANIQEATTKLNGTQGMLGKLLSDEGLGGRLENAVKSLERASSDIATITGKVNQGSGTIETLLNDEKMAKNLQDTVQGVRNVVSTIEEKKIADNLGDIVADARAGKGSLGLLLNDDKLYNNASKALDGIAQATDKIREGKGPMGVILNDEAAGENLRHTFANLDKVSTALADGKGTLGRLVMDDRIIQEAERVLVELRESVEDVREQQPINAFVNAIFQAF